MLCECYDFGGDYSFTYFSYYSLDNYQMNTCLSGLRINRTRKVRLGMHGKVEEIGVDPIMGWGIIK